MAATKPESNGSPSKNLPKGGWSATPPQSSEPTSSPVSAMTSACSKGKPSMFPWLFLTAAATCLLGAVGLRYQAGVREDEFPSIVEKTSFPIKWSQSSKLTHAGKNGCVFSDTTFTVASSTAVYLYPDRNGSVIFTQGKDFPGLRSTREYTLTGGTIVGLGFSGIDTDPPSIGPGTLRVRCSGTTDEMVRKNPAMELTIRFDRWHSAT